ncbi:MAG: hypothetical protein AABX59_03080 [Nanoarchaeota archaeon]
MAITVRKLRNPLTAVKPSQNYIYSIQDVPYLSMQLNTESVPNDGNFYVVDSGKIVMGSSNKDDVFAFYVELLKQHGVDYEEVLRRDPKYKSQSDEDSKKLASADIARNAGRRTLDDRIKEEFNGASLEDVFVLCNNNPTQVYRELTTGGIKIRYDALLNVLIDRGLYKPNSQNKSKKKRKSS